MVSAGSYILSAAALAAVALSLGFSAYRLRAKLLPAWSGAPARLVEAVAAIALLVWLGEALGILSLLYSWSLVASSLALAGAARLWIRPSASTGPHLPGWSSQLTVLISVGVVAVVFAHWGLTTKDALDRGIFNFDSLWYHMPFAAEIAQTHSVTSLHHTETVFTNWFYPQNSELLHATGILLAGRDTLSLLINLGWLGIAFLAAWCVGRPWGRGHLSVAATAIVLACHTLVVREPGAAKNDVVVAALLLAAVAILANAWAARADSDGREGRGTLEPGWALAAAGLATGLAAGTKLTALALAAGLTLAVLVMAPAGRRAAAAGWWFLPALAGGGYWYLHNLIAAGNPLPQVEGIGPISLPHPEQLQSGRPDFTVLHYATDTGIWREYFGPGLEQAFGALWPLVLALAIAGPLLILLIGRERGLRWLAGVALFGMVAYLVTPLSAAGAEGEPEAFSINIRFLVPALLAGLALAPLALPADGTRTSSYWTVWSRRPRWEWALLGALLLLLVLTDRSDAVLRDPDRLFGMLVALLAVLVPAALLLARSRGASPGVFAAGFAGLALAVVAIGYPLQRDYLEDRFRNADPETAIPGMDLDSAYRWAKGVEDARIGLAGTTAGFLQYGFYGDDLSNRVRYLGREAPHGAFVPLETCRQFRAAVNDAELDYLVTAPFLNFIDPGRPIRSPEAGWLRGDPAVRPIVREGGATVWRVRGRLRSSGCGPRNAPLRGVPQQPVA